MDSPRLAAAARDPLRAQYLSAAALFLLLFALYV